jgi:hypothetical protein
VLVANFVQSQQTAMLVVILVFFVPSFFLAGLILPVDTSSPVSSAVAVGLGIGDLAWPTTTRPRWAGALVLSLHSSQVDRLT